MKHTADSSKVINSLSKIKFGIINKTIRVNIVGDII